ncbi:PEP-CTERM sorting domain-containing protein [Haloferula chungangensis]|uniref:PEP-CTERM sorting domain-containing protein n=1 Tax=Haloferula chungangensis TaxID=1048331 RepID=A0ABW2L127_9BACT
MKITRLLSTASFATILTAFCLTSVNAALFVEEFDGTFNYEADGDGVAGDWVDFNGGTRIIGATVGSTAFTEGYTTAAGANNESVLQGVVNHGDPQVRTNGSFSTNWATINLADITTITLRLRIDMNKDGLFNDALAAGNFNVFWGSAAYDTPGAANPAAGSYNNSLGDPTTLAADGAGNFYLATWSGLDLGTGTLESLRIDVRDGGTAAERIGTPFELDRLEVIPEPSSALLLLTGAGTMLLRRRR